MVEAREKTQSISCYFFTERRDKSATRRAVGTVEDICFSPQIFFYELYESYILRRILHLRNFNKSYATCCKNYYNVYVNIGLVKRLNYNIYIRKI